MKVFSILLSLVMVVAADLKSMLVDKKADVGLLGDIAQRIAGGTKVGASVQPYLVGVISHFGPNHRMYCGASMLSNTRSVTAAHCWKKRTYSAVNLTLVFGADDLSSGGTRIETSNVEVHSDFDPRTGHNDIAMISHDFVEYTDTIQPISLPYGAMLEDDFDNKVVTAVGFGDTSDEGPGTQNSERYYVNLRVIPNNVCAETYGTSSITNDILCVSTLHGRSTCNGDSGGPLAYKKKQDDFLVGISSFSHVEGCEKGHPAGFTRVTSYITWITDRI